MLCNELYCSTRRTSTDIVASAEAYVRSTLYSMSALAFGGLPLHYTHTNHRLVSSALSLCTDPKPTHAH